MSRASALAARFEKSRRPPPLLDSNDPAAAPAYVRYSHDGRRAQVYHPGGMRHENCAALLERLAAKDIRATVVAVPFAKLPPTKEYP